MDFRSISSESDGNGRFGVYVHWPFCAQKCPYCDFNSHVRHGGPDETRFLAAYLRELDHVAEVLAATDHAGHRDCPAPVRGPEGSERPRPRRVVSSIFFGGGTPSLMRPETVAAIIGHIGRLWPIAADAEVTLEANPGSVEAGRFAGYRDAGVNRVSMGFQSLDDDQLRRLGRIHTVAEARAALGIAQRTFDRYSFDLIYARPGQSPEAWRHELTEALAMAGQHLSLYQLTIEPGTTYERLHAAGKLVVPDGEAAQELYEVTQELTERAGLPAYEISNHARPGEESRHNLLYWQYGEYAGIGAGAHGRLVYGGARHATQTERNPEAWAALVERKGHGFTEVVRLTPAEEADEALLMGLRLREGLDSGLLDRLAGLRPSEDAIEDLVALGLLETSDNPNARARGLDPASGPGSFDEDFCSIRSCVGPAAPHAERPKGEAGPVRIRATREGRLVLNQIVLRLSRSLVASGQR